jgi:two-component sensor histidine kinase
MNIKVKPKTQAPQSQNETEEAQVRSREELEQRVSERTSELEKSNMLLVKEILERRCAESELKQSLAEKDLLLKEIHHRVKNNLQIISSLLNLQSRKLTDNDALNSFNESNNRIRSIATLHEQLYRSKDLSRINFGAYIENMTDNLLRLYGVRRDWVKIIINSELVLLDINKAIPCGLIVNELISNAIKHGFPNHRAGEIRINFHKADNKFVLTVSNNGVQFPPDLDINNCSTLGLELVSSLCRQLKGKLSLIREGITEFQLEFRL